MLKVESKELNTLPLRDLLDVREKVDDAIKQAKDRERGEVREQLARLAERRGFALADFLHMKSAHRKHKALPPKYANPENPKERWAGQGRKPNWLIAKLDEGAKLDDFRI